MKKFKNLDLQHFGDTYSQNQITTVVINKEGKIIEYNEAMAQLTGYSHGDY